MTQFYFLKLHTHLEKITSLRPYHPEHARSGLENITSTGSFWRHRSQGAFNSPLQTLVAFEYFMQSIDSQGNKKIQ
jgi:hypothetical protein